METDDRGRAPRRRLGTRRDDHSGRRQREHVSALQGERRVRTAIGDTTVRTSVIANADIGPPSVCVDAGIRRQSGPVVFWSVPGHERV